MTKEEIYIKKIRHKVLKTISRFNLIQKNDNILVGISGGKDSLVLLDTLAYLKRKVVYPFYLHAAYIDILNIPYSSDKEYLSAFCRERKVDLNIIEYKVDMNDTEKSPCFVCSWSRRKSLFNLAKKLKIEKIALGHHLDDILQTLFMNMVYQSNISTIPPSLKMEKWDCTILRPLSMCDEEELRMYADILNFTVQNKVCYHGENSGRTAMKNIVDQFGDLSHNAKINMFNSLSNIKNQYLPQKKIINSKKTEPTHFNTSLN